MQKQCFSFDHEQSQCKTNAFALDPNKINVTSQLSLWAQNKTMVKPMPFRWALTKINVKPKPFRWTLSETNVNLVFVNGP